MTIGGTVGERGDLAPALLADHDDAAEHGGVIGDLEGEPAVEHEAPDSLGSPRHVATPILGIDATCARMSRQV
jgi:hypothetical protein